MRVFLGRERRALRLVIMGGVAVSILVALLVLMWSPDPRSAGGSAHVSGHGASDEPEPGRRSDEVVLGASTPQATRRKRRPVGSRLTAAQLAGQRVVFSFDGLQAPPSLLRRISRREAGGVMLFKRNIVDLAQVRHLAQTLQQARQGGDPPLLLMVDQEGGAVNRIPGGPVPSAGQLSRLSPPFAFRAGRDAGRALASAGLNVDLAPVADVGRPASAIRRQERSFGKDPRTVAIRAGAFANGLRSEGIAATAKHFPGFGAAVRTTDRDSVSIGLPVAVIRSFDMSPFRALIGRDVPLVMLSTAVYPAFDARPAALSHRISTDELRYRLGFRGVSISDDLETPAGLAAGPPEGLAVEAAAAGTDLVVFTKTFAAGERAVRALQGSLERGDLRRRPFLESVARVMDLRWVLWQRRACGAARLRSPC